MKFFILYSIIVIIAVCSCQGDPVSPNDVSTDLENVNLDKFDLKKLSFEELPYTIWRLADPENNPNPVDENGVEVFILDGVTYYHPLHLCQRIEWYVDSYYQTRDSFYLNWISKYRQKLMELAVENNDALYFPYDFDWKLHGYDWDQMKAPWLSALTQGIALMVHSRLYSFTGDSTYLTLADKIYNSFYLMLGKHTPWITTIDDKNFLWFEEYPDDLYPNFTLNGFIYCIYGIYEYYMATENEKAEFLVKAAITTIKNYIEDFRVKDDISYYCLKHKAQHWNYHLIHTEQLKTLYHFTGDEYFSAMADSFYNDYHE